MIGRTGDREAIGNPKADSGVAALAVSGSTVYAAGGFTVIGTAARNYIAALDASTGEVTRVSPGLAVFEP